MLLEVSEHWGPFLGVPIIRILASMLGHCLGNSYCESSSFMPYRSQMKTKQPEEERGPALLQKDIRSESCLGVLAALLYVELEGSLRKTCAHVSSRMVAGPRDRFGKAIQIVMRRAWVGG